MRLHGQQLLEYGRAAWFVDMCSYINSQAEFGTALPFYFTVMTYPTTDVMDELLPDNNSVTNYDKRVTNIKFMVIPTI